MNACIEARLIIRKRALKGYRIRFKEIVNT